MPKEQILILSALRGIRSELSTGTPESGEEAAAIFREYQAKAPISGDSMIDVAGLNKHFGRCRIGVQGEWDVTVPSTAFREALGNIGKKDAKPVTASGTFISHDGKIAGAISGFTVATPSEGLATITISIAPSAPVLTAKRPGYGSDFAHIAPRTLEFRSVIPPAGVDAPAK